ncbi:MAG: KUP/HAK/KT family potassium transporter [Caulobacteraceae bacterium]
MALALGAVGVVYGDIGTSPLYAFKESIAHVRAASGALAAADITGIISLMLWALMIIVTLKYVFLIMRFDNKGEGGTLALMALVRRAGGRGAGAIALIGMLGAGLFFGDAVLTPAVSVLSAVEGLTAVEYLQGRLDIFVVPLALLILVLLFVAQRGGTGKLGAWFGPICLAWFMVISILGLAQIIRAPQILAAISPLPGIATLAAHPGLAAAILGSVFLTVTGAEALYADMGHFGRGPIRSAWLGLVFPSLIINYLGQGALVLGDPAMAANPFFLMAPDWFQVPLVLLATAATIIASQAVISGAFSMTQQAVQLGLLPRIAFLATSPDNPNQTYAPAINWLLMAGVVALILAFRSSSALASAYGISVVGAMITSSILAIIAVRRVWNRPLAVGLALVAPLILVEGLFAFANLSKLLQGGYVPLLIAAVLILVMWTWTRGASAVSAASRRDLTLSDVLQMLADRPPMRARGTAVFLTAEDDRAPAALLHNLKHNQVLHEQVVLLSVRYAPRPRVPDAERAEVRELAPGVKAVTLVYGFMENPNVSQGLVQARSKGLRFDIMKTSFFLSRRTLLRGGASRLPAWQAALFFFLNRNAARAADFFHLPASRVVELGAQVTV